VVAGADIFRHLKHVQRRARRPDSGGTFRGGDSARGGCCRSNC
jgi:hypothetical protein